MYATHKFNHIVQSVLLLGGMTVLLALLGWFLAGSIGLVLAAAGIIVFLAGTRMSAHILLRLYRARRLQPYEAPALYRMLQLLAQRAGLSALPQLYVAPSVMMNAFAVGPRDDAAIAVTDGLVRRLSQRELVGVLAHEISHIRNNDTWVMSVADGVSRLTSILSRFGQVLLLVSIPLMLVGAYSPPWLFLILLIAAPTLSELLQLALSRTREFDADLDAIRLTGDPDGLASALHKLERNQLSLWERLAMPGRDRSSPSWLRTHPATAERIRRLFDFQGRTVPLAL